MKKQLGVLTTISISAFIAFGVLFSNGALNRLTNIHAASFSYGVTFNSAKNKFHAYTRGSASDLRTSKATDYAMAKYVYAYEGEAYLHNSIYWTRSPDSENRTFVSSVKWNGELTSYRANGYGGVRPCIKLGAALS